MKLNKDQIKKFSGIFEESIIRCPVCNFIDWDLSTTVFELNEFHEPHSGPTFMKISTPVVPVMCTNCGNTLLFNAIHLGIVDKTNE